MNILLLSKADIQGNINLNTLVPILAKTHRVDVLLSDALLPIERGTPYADLCTWYDRDYLLDTYFPAIDAMQDVKFAPAALQTFQGLRRWCANLETIPASSPHTFLEERLRMYQPDLVICCRFDYILKKTELDLPPLGVINTHSGHSPSNCGPNATFRAMYMGVTKSACTLHWANSSVDAGAIIAQPTVALDYTHTLLWNRMQVYAAGMQALIKLLPQIVAKTAPAQEQDISLRHYYPYPTEQELNDFVKQGKRLYCPKEYRMLLTRFLPLGTSPDIRFTPPSIEG